MVGDGFPPEQSMKAPSAFKQKSTNFCFNQASQVALMLKNSPANARDVRDTGLISELGRSPGGGHGNLL